MTTAAPAIPGYKTGTWTIDAVHSEVGFSVRHMMVSKVRGRFGRFSGTVVTGPQVTDSSVTATIELDSIDTNNEQRDGHIKSADFFNVEQHPTMTYRSTSITPTGEGSFRVDGELTLKGVTRNVPLSLELGGFGPDAYGGYRVGFSATAEINRSEFGVDISMPMETGGVVVGEKVSISLEIEAVLDTAAAA
jgi:polyisoprenoid-binding protein YceI